MSTEQIKLLADKTESKNMNNNNWYIVGALVVGIIIGLIIGYKLPNRNGVNTDQTAGEINNATSTAISATGDTLTVSDQNPGLTVTVDSVNASGVAWLVVKETTDNPRILGASRVEPGQHGNVMVELLRGTVAGQTYEISLATDDGDGLFDFKKDQALTDAAGKPLIYSFHTSAIGSRGN